MFFLMLITGYLSVGDYCQDSFRGGHLAGRLASLFAQGKGVPLLL